ncbi:UTP--glucose-1-phosphate uridylyltransferase [Granulicoccus sp. GXG6511]|uniref:UTP--glucose-1-phosphate uridylyltransferase n=1 Tax=Granulicoccus sp. GXG6511 TaxID=3381351 RepID=UPI003D7CBA81
MSGAGLRQAIEKMEAAGQGGAPAEVFKHYYQELESGATGVVPEADIEPVGDLPLLEDQQVDPEQAREALAATVMIRLNGGLGTSMGMSKAKSLLPVTEDRTFLDLIVDQVRATREAHGVRLPLVLMNSFRTREDTLEALAAHEDLPVDGLPLDFMQSSEPKLRSDDLTPVEWPDDPDLEWCPPGHGDIYPSLLASGLLDELVARGFRYALVANSDNLGATPDPRLAGWFAASGAPFAIEVCARTKADRKGGHLAVRRSDGRLILREVAQTAPEDLDAFTDENRHRWFSTNTLWWDLQQLRDVLTERRGVLGLPLIRNTKTVDPGDPDSPEVFQIETAMGAAIEVFEGATAIGVPRSRFLPVKTTNDLLLLRSDTYAVGADGSITLDTEKVCHVDLDPRFFKRIGDFDQRFPQGVPSLRDAESLTVRGDWTFGPDVRITGRVDLEDAGDPAEVEPGATIEGL